MSTITAPVATPDAEASTSRTKVVLAVVGAVAVGLTVFAAITGERSADFTPSNYLNSSQSVLPEGHSDYPANAQR